MITAEFRLRIPEDRWIGAVSRAYPDAIFRLLADLRAEEGVIQLGSVVAPDPDPIVEAVRSHASISSFQVLDRAEDTVVARYRTNQTGLYDFVEASSLPPEYPIVVRDGRADMEFTATRDDLEEFRSHLEATGTDYEVRSLLETPDEAGLLTDRQREVLSVALRQGYFEVPRARTLEAVADSIGIDKSTASGILRRAQERVLTWYVTGLDASADAEGTPDGRSRARR